MCVGPPASFPFLRVGEKALLDNVSGILREKKMVALMGLSGSGKACLKECAEDCEALRVTPQASLLVFES